MTPTPEQVAQWAQWGAAKHGHTIKWTDEIRETITSIVTRAIAEQAEADAKLCENEWSNVAEKMFGNELAATIRANAPKVDT